MDAIALARSLDELQDSRGTISLRALQAHLSRQGLDELAQAVDTLARKLTKGKPSLDRTVPWI